MRSCWTSRDTNMDLFKMCTKRSDCSTFIYSRRKRFSNMARCAHSWHVVYNTLDPLFIDSVWVERFATKSIQRVTICCYFIWTKMQDCKVMLGIYNSNSSSESCLKKGTHICILIKNIKSYEKFYKVFVILSRSLAS